MIEVFKKFFYLIVIFSITTFSIKSDVEEPSDVEDPREFLELQQRYINLGNSIKTFSDDFVFYCKKSQDVFSDKAKIEFDLDVKDLKRLYLENRERLDNFTEFKDKLARFEFLTKCWKKAKLKLDILAMYLDFEHKSLNYKQLTDAKLNTLLHIYDDSKKSVPVDENLYITETIIKFLPSGKIIKLFNKIVGFKSIARRWLANFYVLAAVDIEDDEEVFALYKRFNVLLYSDDEQKVYSLLLDIQAKKNEINDRIKKIILDLFMIQLIKNRKNKILAENVIESLHKNDQPKITIEFKGLDDDLIVESIKKLFVSIKPFDIVKGATFASWDKLLSLVHIF